MVVVAVVAAIGMTANSSPSPVDTNPSPHLLKNVSYTSLKSAESGRLTLNISSPSPVATAAPFPSLYSPAPTMGKGWCAWM